MKSKRTLGANGDNTPPKTPKAKPRGRPPKPSTAKPKRRELTEREAAQRDRMRAQNLERDERPEAKFVRVVERGKVNITITNADRQDEVLHSNAMMEALGTRSLPFLNDTMDNIIRVMSPSRNITEQQYNAALAILASVEPQNELEATLASQMVAANDCAMRSMRAMGGTDVADHHKMYGDLANKFMRTFTAQVEALARLRRGGEQIVKHVYVQEGGQAVIAGTVNAGGRDNLGNVEQPFGAAPAPQCAALPGPDAAWDGVPIPRHAERKMSHSRREESGTA